MKFLDVSTSGFGAIRNASIAFAPKFTVIYGPNEAGKSTWHAALNAGFCGMRRSRGQSPGDEEFTRRYRPWDVPEPWEVSVVFMLRDGRKVELRQELIDRIDCQATDVDFGRDYTNEIINEGSPDGSVWLGLDRRSFLATACIKQTQMLEVLNNPEILQTHMRRAAATCAINSNGASALQLIEGFRAEYVGEDRANSTRPLRRAIRRVETMKAALETARAEHARYLELIASENVGRGKLEKLRLELNLARAVIAHRDADDWERRLERIQEILKNHPERPSADLDHLNDLVSQVSSALKVWRERPVLPDLSGATAAEIEAEIEGLPAWPDGDVEPDPQVLKTEADYHASKYALTLHTQAEPPQAAFPKTAGFSSEQLRQFCSIMQEPEPAADPRVEQLSRITINERLIQRVHTAIEVWERRPNLAKLSGPTVEEIRSEINTLPVAGEGELEPAPEIIDAAHTCFSAKEALRQHELNRPADAFPPSVEGVSPSELRTLAVRLRAPAVVSTMDVKIRLRSVLKKELEELSKTRTMWIAGSAALSLLALIPLFLMQGQQRLVLTGGTVVAVMIVTWLVSRWKTTSVQTKKQELETLQEELDGDSYGLNEWGQRQKDVMERIEKFKLPSNPEALDALAGELEAAQDAERLNRLWEETAHRLESTLQGAVEKVQSLLREKINGDVDDVENALAQYQQQCAERSHTATLANRRVDLERQLTAKIEFEKSADEINQRRRSAEAELREVAAICEVTAENDQELIKRLHEWLDERDRLKALQAELGQHAFVKVAWKQRQLEMREELQSKGLPADLKSLRALADALDEAHSVQAVYEKWSATLSRLTQGNNLRFEQLKRLLESKGLEVSDNLEEVLEHYRKGCEARSQQAQESGRREGLQSQLALRRQVEDAAAKISEQRQNAYDGMVVVAERCGISTDDEGLLAQDLHAWLNETTQEIQMQREGLEQWRELDTLLEGRTLPEFKAKVQLHHDNALILSSAFSEDELREAMPNLDQYEATVADLGSQTELASQELANIQGQIRHYEGRTTSVSDAEEELKAAEEGLAKIRLLDETLETTHVFLTQAQDKVHKDIAPFLAQFIKRYLPDITMGRYVDAKVDLTTLQVQVCDQTGKWREAALLSHGTAEQIYLLLRMAMTEYLTSPSETCPLILDDITVQSDSRRKERILATLKVVSETRQVILFTQEEEVFLWARENLCEPDDRIIELAPAVGTVMQRTRTRRMGPRYGEMLN